MNAVWAWQTGIVGAFVVAQGFAFLVALFLLGKVELKRSYAIRVLVTDEGPKIFGLLPTISGTDLEGRSFHSENLLGRRWVLLFSSPGCAACEHFFRCVEKTRRGLPESVEFVFVMEAKPEAIRRSIRRHRLSGMFVVDEDGAIHRAMEIERTPQGILVEANGTVGMKGVVNERLMLESLIEGRGYFWQKPAWQTVEETSEPS